MVLLAAAMSALQRERCMQDAVTDPLSTAVWRLSSLHDVEISAVLSAGIGSLAVWRGLSLHVLAFVSTVITIVRLLSLGRCSDTNDVIGSDVLLGIVLANALRSTQDANSRPARFAVIICH
jgi:hypothetical protein